MNIYHWFKEMWVRFKELMLGRESCMTTPKETTQSPAFDQNQSSHKINYRVCMINIMENLPHLISTSFLALVAGLKSSQQWNSISRLSL